MGSLWTRVMSAGVAIVLAASAAPAQGADFVRVEKVTAAAEITISTCPWEPPSQVGLICTDTYLLYFQARNKGSTGPPEPWSLFIIESTWVSVSGEEEWQLVSERLGFAPALDGYVDAQHMLTAAVRGTIPMSEGDPITVNLRWDLSDAELQAAGNNGPTEGFSWGVRGRDGCVVVNKLAHQRWRWDYDGVSGTLGGVDVQDLYLPTEHRGVFIEGSSTFIQVYNQTGVECVPA